MLTHVYNMSVIQYVTGHESYESWAKVRMGHWTSDPLIMVILSFGPLALFPETYVSAVGNAL